MGSDGKLPTSATAVKGPKGWAQRFLNVGFVAGFLLVLLTYALVSQQSQRFGAVVASSDDVTASITSKQAIKAPGEAGLAQEDGGEEKTRPAEASADHHQHQETSGDSNQDQQQQKPEQEWRPKAVVTEEPPKRDDTDAKPFDNGKVVLTTAGPYSDTCDVFGDVPESPF